MELWMMRIKTMTMMAFLTAKMTASTMETANMMAQKREILMMMVFPMMWMMMMIMMAFLTKKMMMMTMMAFLTKMIMTMIIMMILIMMVFPMMMTMMAFPTKNMRKRIQKNSQRMILKKALQVLLGSPLPFLPLSLGALREMSCDKKEQMNLLQYHFPYHYLSFTFQIFNRSCLN